MIKDGNILLLISLCTAVTVGIVVLVLVLIKRKGASSNKGYSLLDSCIEVDELTGDFLTAWFRENNDLLADDVKMIVTYSSDKILKSLRVNNEDMEIPDRNIIQMFFDDKRNICLKARMISYKNIDTNLESSLEEQDGFMLVSE